MVTCWRPCAVVVAVAIVDRISMLAFAYNAEDSDLEGHRWPEFACLRVVWPPAGSVVDCWGTYLPAACLEPAVGSACSDSEGTAFVRE